MVRPSWPAGWRSKAFRSKEYFEPELMVLVHSLVLAPKTLLAIPEFVKLLRPTRVRGGGSRR
jgi:hypothetical protein